jgi:hypothetical protein
MFGEWTETDCHVYEISTTWETKPWTTLQKTSETVNGTGIGHEASKPASCMMMI